MKRFLFVAGLIFSLTACTKDDALDGSIAPAINEKIEALGSNCFCEPYVEKYQWQGKYVYLFLTAGPACLSSPTYFNEDGTPVTMASTYTYTDFRKDAVLVKKVWSCSTGRL